MSDGSFVPRRMRIKDAARYLGISPSKLRSDVASGKLPAGIKSGACVYWLRDDLDDVINKQFGRTGSVVGAGQELDVNYDPFADRFGGR